MVDASFLETVTEVVLKKEWFESDQQIYINKKYCWKRRYRFYINNCSCCFSVRFRIYAKIIITCFVDDVYLMMIITQLILSHLLKYILCVCEDKAKRCRFVVI